MLSLEISYSIIYPKSYTPSDRPDSFKIDLAPPPFPPPKARGRSTLSTLANADLKIGEEHPLYRLPQSVSSGGLKIHLNNFVPVKLSNKGPSERPHRRSDYSAIDEDHIIFEIVKTSIGESDATYAFTNIQREDGEGSYGRANMTFTPGWFSGGTWTARYLFKGAGDVQDSRIDLKVDEGGKQDGVWKMTYPLEGTVALERKQAEGAFGENGRVLDIIDGKLEGWADAEWRDFLTACWITKVWNNCTRSGWLSSSIRSGEGAGLATW